MSRPGDPGRVQLEANGAQETVLMTVDLIRSLKGAKSFELRYTAADRELAPDEEPRADERVRWEAIAVIRRGAGRAKYDRTYIGSAVVEPGHHERGQALAAAHLLEQLGANTVVLDMTDDTDPREVGR